VVERVLPETARAYPAPRVDRVGIGGSSYGAIAALRTALRHPGAFDRLLLESAPVWVGQGRLVDDLRRGARVPSRVYLGVAAGSRSATTRARNSCASPVRSRARSAPAARALTWLFAN
jgi:enterochelin esterase-like enzyme